MSDTLHLPELVAAWDRPDFDTVLAARLAALGQPALPLQAGLRHGNYALDAPLSVVPLRRERRGDRLWLRARLFYTSVIAGCSCADDPTPVDTLTESCEIELSLDPASGAAQITLCPD